jgi:hypothetical protein
MRTLFPSAVVILASACGAGISPYARTTAGRIGCPAENIELSQVERAGGGPQSWVAFCGETGYACSSSGDPHNPRARVVCSPLGRPHPVSAYRGAVLRE